MSNIVILYHSGVGNTKLVSERMFENLQTSFDVQIFSIEDSKSYAAFQNATFVIFGFPTFHCEPSKSIMKFIDMLPENCNGKQVFAFTTCGLYAANTLRIFAKFCMQKNIQMIHHQTYYTSASDGSLLFPRIKSMFTEEKNLRKKIDHDMEMLRTKLDAPQISAYVPRFKFYSILNGPNKFIAKIVSPTIYVHQARCIECNVCVDHCPYNCLSFVSTKRLIYIKKNCEHCYRCIHHCPKQALSLSKKRIVKKQLTFTYYQNEK